ncbi:uncharacterized protein LOC110702565 isoform X1 [Chenopodium quinoa]|uniref:Uncharacterized protein n=2 Tax=Chenopodium quinoa TaxID=63459 RepID=A0A803LQY0_CHEQI|nr:uncharacterized protein LOC110702565 isoform X1 [Chenopodium quinoa]
MSILNILGISLFFFSTFTYGNGVDQKELVVGKELFKESLPFQMGSRYYLLQGLKPDTWYEVKISYPATTPAMFSLQLKRGVSDVGLNRLRKLLNTEKLIFKAEDLDEINRQGGLYVLITVEPEGFVAIPGVQERENILFNIVCDELMLGIPHKAWLVAAFALLCVVVGFSVPRFLPPFLLPRDQDLKRAGQLATEKDS